MGADLVIRDRFGMLPLDYALQVCGVPLDSAPTSDADLGTRPLGGHHHDERHGDGTVSDSAAGASDTEAAAQAPDVAADAADRKFEERIAGAHSEDQREHLKWLRHATQTVQGWHEFWAANEWRWVDPEHGNPYLYSYRTGFVCRGDQLFVAVLCFQLGPFVCMCVPRGMVPQGVPMAI